MKALDVIFHVFHIVVIIFNTFFWMSFRTLRIAQVTQVLTLISWVGFGFWYGFGYCFLTDWHWQVKERLGEKDLPSSYIKYVLDGLSNSNWNPDTVDKITVSMLVVSLIGCLVQTYRKNLRRRRGISLRNTQAPPR